MSNLPDGCTDADIDRAMNGDWHECPACGEDVEADEPCAECGWDTNDDCREPDEPTEHDFDLAADAYEDRMRR